MSRDPDKRTGAPVGVALRPVKIHTENSMVDTGLDSNIGDDVAAARSDSPAGYASAYAGVNSGAMMVRFSKR